MQLLRIPLRAVVGLFLQFSAPARAQSPSPGGCPHTSRAVCQADGGSKVIVDTSHPDPYNSSLKYNRILTSIYTPVSKIHCSEHCEDAYYPPATAAFADKSLDAPNPSSSSDSV